MNTLAQPDMPGLRRLSRLGSCLLLAGGLALVGTAGAADGQIELTMEAAQEVRVTEDGETRIKRVEPEKVLPGEEVIYTITYHNAGEEPATNVTITNVIPDHMDYVVGSATGADTEVQFSVDGGSEYGPPEALTVIGEDGEPHPAGPKDYTHVRWLLEKPVAPQESGSVSYQARLQ